MEVRVKLEVEVRNGVDIAWVSGKKKRMEGRDRRWDRDKGREARSIEVE